MTSKGINKNLNQPFNLTLSINNKTKVMIKGWASKWINLALPFFHSNNKKKILIISIHLTNKLILQPSDIFSMEMHSETVTIINFSWRNPSKNTWGSESKTPDFCIDLILSAQPTSIDILTSNSILSLSSNLKLGTALQAIIKELWSLKQSQTKKA